MRPLQASWGEGADARDGGLMETPDFMGPADSMKSACVLYYPTALSLYNYHYC